MNILITGSQGYIGKYLSSQLDKHIVMGCDLKTGDDIFDHAIEGMIRRSDIVIHLAALTSVDDSQKKKADYYYTNILGTARIAQLCYKYKKKLIYISSAAQNQPTTSDYANSKFITEVMLKPFLKLMKLVVLRPENIYGGEMKKGTLLYNFINDKKLVINGDGTQTRDYIHIDDFCEIIKASFSSKWDHKMVEVGTGIALSVEEIAKIIHERTGKEIVYNKKASPGVMHSVADTYLLWKLYHKQLSWKVSEYIKTVPLKKENSKK